MWGQLWLSGLRGGAESVAKLLRLLRKWASMSDNIMFQFLLWTGQRPTMKKARQGWPKGGCACVCAYVCVFVVRAI